MQPEPPPFQLREPGSIESLLPGWWLPPVLLAATLLIALTLIAFLLIRLKNRPTPPNPAKLREQARLKSVAALENARATSPTPREAAVRASLILRDYLATAAEDPALFETHEEFIARHDSLAALSESTRQSAATAFTSLAAIKYSSTPPPAATAQVIESARTLLDELHRGFITT